MPENEKKPVLKTYKKASKVLAIIGGILLAIGITAMVVGIVYTFGFEDAHLFFLIWIGMSLMFVGGCLLMFGLIGLVSRYMAGQTAPVAKDTANYMMDGTRDEEAKTAKAMAHAVKDGLREDGDDGTVACPSCGEKNPKGSAFCSHCGAKIVTEKTCPHCGNRNPADATYCNHCGTRF
jgi:ribosomal protein L40E